MTRSGKKTRRPGHVRYNANLSLLKNKVRKVLKNRSMEIGEWRRRYEDRYRNYRAKSSR